MSRYRAIHCLIWNDDKFPFLDDDTRLVFFHLLTTPFSTPFGLYKSSLGALSDEIRWEKKRYEKAFREAFVKGFVKHDEKTLLILIPKFLRYNPPNNPNVLRSWGKTFAELPNSELKDECFELLKALSKGLGKAFQEAFSKAFTKHDLGSEKGFKKGQKIPLIPKTKNDCEAATDNDLKPSSKPMPIQEQDQYQNQLKDIPEVSDLIPYQEIVGYLNSLAGTSYRHTAGPTRDKINARWRDGFRLEDFKSVIDAKCKEWCKDAKYSKYLRPETLFGTKFEGYLNTSRLKVVPSTGNKAVNPDPDWF